MSFTADCSEKSPFVNIILDTMWIPISDRDLWPSSPAPTWAPTKSSQLLVRVGRVKSTEPVFLQPARSTVTGIAETMTRRAPETLEKVRYASGGSLRPAAMGSAGVASVITATTKSIIKEQRALPDLLENRRLT